MMQSRLMNLAWIGLEKFGLTLVSLVTFFIYAQYLGPHEFGVAIIALSIGQGISLIIGNLFQDALVQHKSPDKKHYSSAFWGGNVLSLIICSLIVLCLVFVQTKQFVLLVAFSLIQVPLVVSSAGLIAFCRRESAFKKFTITSVVARLLGATLGLVMVALGTGAWAVVAQSVAIAGITFFGLFMFNARIVELSLSAKCIRELLSMGWALSVRRLSWDLTVRGIPLTLGVVAGPTAVGIFALAWRLVEMPRSAIASGLNSYALPVLSRHQHNRTSLGHMFQAMTAHSTIVIMPIFFGLAAISPIMINTLFDQKWQSSIALIQILALVTAINSSRLYVPTALTATSRPAVNLHIDILSTLLALVVTAFAGIYFGALAGAGGYLARLLVSFPATFFSIREVFSIHVRKQLSGMRSPLIGSLMMFLAVSFVAEQIEAPGWISLVLLVCFGAAIYISAITLLHRKWFDEMRAWLSGSVS